MPIPKNDVKKILENAFPDAKIALDDLTGTQDHYRVILVTQLFEGKSLLQRHQAVNQALAEPLKGPIHALSIEAYTETEWNQKNPPL